MIYVHFDGDDIGATLELMLLDEDVERAREHSAAVARGLVQIHAALLRVGGVDIFVSGGDDLVAVFSDGTIGLHDLDRLRSIFFETCGKTMSAGVGFTASQATQNLRRAKLMGKDTVVSPMIISEIVSGVETKITQRA